MVAISFRVGTSAPDSTASQRLNAVFDGDGEAIMFSNSDFAINCGGPQINSSSGIEFDSDENPVGPASYFVTDTKKWAVSNGGFFMDIGGNPKYISSTPTEIKNTLDTKLMQTARVSGGSLRYYGLGLENENYNVELFFVETAFQDSPSWTNLGRRVFDIYIQGELRVKDFDIRKEANGALLQAVRKQFMAKVSENYLEIHLFWAGKGTCCTPARGTYGPTVSAISATSDFVPTINKLKPPKRVKTRLIILSTVLGVTITCLSVLAVVYIHRKRVKMLNTVKRKELIDMDATPQAFAYAELKTATEDFSPSNKLGQGGFGHVYQGILGDGRAVAIKKLSEASHQGRDQFAAEIATISAVQHRNLVRLYGCCIEGDERLLVYEYLSNNSLDQALFGKRKLDLNWPMRFNICLGVAKGLAYLHEDSLIRIVHRDVKASNILLDSDLNPKISDFGLAKLYDCHMTHISTQVAGTIGYLAPDLSCEGTLQKRLMCLALAWNLRENDRERELIDSRLSDESNMEEVKRVIAVAFLCTQSSPLLRPPMSKVVRMLMGDNEVSPVTSRPAYLDDINFGDVASFVSGNSSYSNFLTPSKDVTEPGCDGIIEESP
ncbi:Protein kinase domain - like 10 [Theobroma cacao]|nr:Protein kinase domain - like 10 [Theobroma cacao]